MGGTKELLAWAIAFLIEHRQLVLLLGACPLQVLIFSQFKIMLDVLDDFMR